MLMKRRIPSSRRAGQQEAWVLSSPILEEHEHAPPPPVLVASMANEHCFDSSSDRSTFTATSTKQRPDLKGDAWAYASCRYLLNDHDDDDNSLASTIFDDEEEAPPLWEEARTDQRKVNIQPKRFNIHYIETRHELPRNDIWYSENELCAMRQEAIYLQKMLDDDPSSLDYEESEQFSSRGIEPSLIEVRRSELRSILMMEIQYYQIEQGQGVESTTTPEIENTYFDSTVPEFLCELTECTSKEAISRGKHDLLEAIFIYKECKSSLPRRSQPAKSNLVPRAPAAA